MIIEKNIMPSIMMAYEKYKEIDFNDNNNLIKSLEAHKLEQAFYYQIKNTKFINRFNNEEIENLKNTSLFNMFKMKLHEKEIEAVYKRFNEDGVIAVALKGLVTKEYYDIPELRKMGDSDILIKEDDLKKVENILNELGYLYSKETTYHKVYKKKNRLRIEVHTSLISEENYKRKNPYDGIFDRIREIDIGSERGYALGYTDQLIHLITHMLTHIAASKISLRQILDITLFINNESDNIDFEDFKKRGIEFDYYNLSTVILNICDEFFGCKIPEILKDDCDSCNKKHKEVILEALFSRGVFDEDKIAYIIGNGVGYSKGEYKRGAFYRHIRFVFPSYDVMSKKYNYCNKYKILLPIAWIHRLLSGGATKEKSILKKIRMFIRSFKVSKKKNDLLKTLDL